MLHNSLRSSRFEVRERSFPAYVWSVKLISSKSIAVRWPDLPVGIKSGISARVGDQLFVGLGTAGNDLYRLDLASAASGWTKRAPFPGATTSGAACGSVDGLIYVFSGTGSSPVNDTATIFDTVHVYDVALDRWSQLNTQTPCGLLGARAAALCDGRIVIVGGYNKAVFDGFVADMAAIDKERQPEQAEALRRSFLGKEPKEYRWNAEVLCFDPLTHSWDSLGQSPFLPNCDASLVCLGDNLLLLVSGEIKPGLRTPEVKVLKIDGQSSTWKLLAELQPPVADEMQEGIAGAYAGVADGTLLVAGGTNFRGSRANAKVGKWFAHDGLDKIWRDEVYAFDGNYWREVGKLPRGLAHGACFSTGRGLLMVGGEDGDSRARTEVLLLNWNGKVLSIEN